MTTFFYDTIYRMRSNEELILYDRVLQFIEEDEALVQDFLEIEYNLEKQNYPFTAPSYNPTAALWAAKIVYTTCQLILYREHQEEEIPDLLPAYEQELDASAILSADLCLRFLPEVLKDTKHIDPDDKLIELVETILKKWHFSSIGYFVESENYEMKLISRNSCLLQMYTDRVITTKDTSRADLPIIKSTIMASVGNYGEVFWKE